VLSGRMGSWASVRCVELGVELPYGRGHVTLDVDLPNLTVVSSKPRPPLSDPLSSLAESLKRPLSSPPLSDLCRGAESVLVIVPDKTRAFPFRLVLPEVLRAVKSASPQASTRVLVATGLHRPHGSEELEELVGREVASEYEVVSHDAEDEGLLADTGRRTSWGTPVVVNRGVLESDLVVALGLIEPHFFAGYSGGRKSLLPGVAGRDAILANHGFRMIGHPKARYGCLSGNPIHEDMVEFMRMTRLDFIVNVTLNERKEVTGVFCGDPVEAHLAGVRFLESYVRVPVRGRADVVIVTNGGYPLDRDLYQAVKGIATGELVVREGGAIVVLAECVDGLGGHEEFHELFVGARSPEEVLERIRRREPVKDQWQAQILARVLARARVVVVTDMSHSVVEDMLMTPASSVEEALEEAARLAGRDLRSARVVAVPEGPYVIPELAG